MAGSPNSVPWRNPAWQDRVAAWTAERMSAAGFPPTGPTIRSYEGPLATLLRTPSSRGALYTKCSIPLFVAEPRTTKAIADGTPAWAPRVIDIDPDQGWLLMQDFGARILGDELDTAWPVGLELHARLQRAWVGRTEELRGAGAVSRPLGEIADALPGLLDVGGLGDRVGAALRRAWPSTAERLAAACRELEDVGIPETVVHGDLHPWNIARTPTGMCIFDWSDTAVGSPFLDVAVYLGRARRVARPAILGSYVAAWSDVAPLPTLEQAAALAMPVGAIYQVLTYQRIATALAGEEPSDFAGADVGWLENAIAGLEHGLEARFTFGPDESPDED